ncbi:MAG: WD40 repeat domain-containing serine/threonine protein kinase [Dokdonella sp.]
MSANQSSVNNRIDPLAWVGASASALAALAFGGDGRNAAPDITQLRHLALLPVDALELDLSDPTQRQFGDYELLELIGEGGMGVVYRARQISLDREVAVKLLAAGPWASRDFVERFRREAQNAARMQHPNIVAIYEVGSAEELHFFSMRLVRGRSLAEAVRDSGELDADPAAKLMRTVAEALAYAHSLGVLHLDLKPANILLDENGTPHVADFGLARRLDSALAVDNEEVSGTPSYMAPEQAQARAHKLSAATDIWGLGAILYELVTGQPPFRGANAQETIRLVLESNVRSPRLSRSRLPLDLDAVILKCLAADPSERYGSARDLADDLGRFIERRAVRARPLNRAQRFARWVQREPRVAIASALGVIVLLIGLVATNQQWRRAEDNAATASVRLWEGRREAALRLQRDGEGFKALPALISNIEEKERLKSGNADMERLGVGVILANGVALVNRMHLGNAINASPFAAELSPDGTRFALAMTDLTVHWYDTRTMRELGHVDLLGLPTSTDTPQTPVLLRFMDDHRLQVTLDWVSFHPSPGTDDAYLIDLDAGKVVPFPDAFSDLSSASFSADGNYALLSDRAAHIQLWQTSPWKALSPLVVKGNNIKTAILSRDGQHVYAIGSAQNSVAIYDSRTLANPESIALPTVEGISAWAESANGAYLALGDFQGSIFLLDTKIKKARQLSAPPGREVTWIAFSEDDAWVAAVRWDGSAYAFVADSGNPLNAGLMKQDFELRRVAISHRERLVVASGLGKSGLWRLPQPGPTGTEASRIITSPTRDVTGGPYSLGFCLRTGEMISAETDGEVRLWQAPASPVLEAQAASQIPGNLQYDGEHVVDVQYNKVRVVSTIHGESAAWIELAQPVTYAEFVDGGRSLAVTSGAQLSVFDSATMQRRFAPIDLGGNPLRMATNAQTHIISMTFPTEAHIGFAERIESYDVRTGKSQAAPVVVAGPLRQLELSADGTRLLATGPAQEPTQVFDARTLQRIGSYRTGDGSAVIWASFQPHGDSLWVLSRENDPSQLSNELVSWNPQTNAILDSRTFGDAWAAAVIAVSDKPFVAGREVDLIDPGKPDERRIPSPTRDEVTSALAQSHHGHLIAHGFRYGVQLYDAANGAAAGPLLHADLIPLDGIAQLAFSPNDDQLLGRTMNGLWVLWHIAKDSRATASLRQDAELISAPANAPVLRRSNLSDAMSKSENWPAFEPRPEIPAAGYFHGEAIPARAAGTSPLMLDLTTVYNITPESEFSQMSAALVGMDGFMGIVRIDGIDYDVRGATQLQAVTGRQAGIGFSSDAKGISVPPTPIAAFHVFLLASMETPIPEGQVEAQLRVHYLDGSVALLPMRSGRELPGDPAEKEEVPMGWVHGDMLRLMGYARQILLSNPRLPNPHPERIIASIDLEAVNAASTPAFFAVTAEPVIQPGVSVIPVATSQGFVPSTGP